MATRCQASAGRLLHLGPCLVDYRLSDMALPKSLFALFFLQLSLGIVLCLPLLQSVGRGFQRFNSAMVLMFVLLVAGFLLRPGDPGPATWAGWCLVGFAAALVLYQAGLWRGTGDSPRGLQLLMVVGGVAAGCSYFYLMLPEGLPAWQAAYCMAGLLATTAVLGAVMGAMILGHWYLVRFDLPIDPFKLMTTLLLIALGVRLVLSAASIPLFVTGTDELGQSSAVLFLNRHIVFLLPRFLMGNLVALVFAWMAHETVKIKSKQSATGILYVAIVPIFIGELMADFLYLVTKVPV